MLTKLRRVTARRQKVDEEWRQAIRAAHTEGASLREIAAAAGVSHVHVRRIVRG